jgi:hypothetical protein
LFEINPDANNNFAARNMHQQSRLTVLWQALMHACFDFNNSLIHTTEVSPLFIESIYAPGYQLYSLRISEDARSTTVGVSSLQETHHKGAQKTPHALA